MFEQLFNNHLLYSLSITLLHFLWQGLLVGFILKSALLMINKSRSKLRYGLATLAMLTNLVIVCFTFALIYSDVGIGTNHIISPLPLDNLVSELTQDSRSLSYQELIPSILAYSLPYISIFWLTTVIVLAGKLLIQVRSVNLLPLHGTVSPSDALLVRFEQLARQIQLPKTPKLLISLKVDVPMAIGWLKPVVLLPATMVTGLDSAQLEMLLLHELAHIRRHDYLVNFFQTIIELLLFFHPAVHWIGKQMRNEREYCSDDVAVHHCGDAIAYAHTLTDTASLCAHKRCHTIPTMAMAASGGDLKARVVRLVDHHCAPSNDKSKWLAALSLLLGLAFAGINQLLTTPIAFQFNSQFPWYENSQPLQINQNIDQQSNSKIVKSDSSIAFNSPMPLSSSAPTINNYIALQLLQNNMNDQALVAMSATNDTFIPAKISTADSESTLPTSEYPPEASIENKAQSSTEENIGLVATSRVDPVNSIDVEGVSVAPSKASTTKILNKQNSPVKVAKQPVKKPTIESSKLIESYTADTFVTDTFASQVAGKDIIATETSASETSTNVTPDTVKKPLPKAKIKAGEIAQQSYSQAIDLFESQNAQYNVAHTLNNDSAPQFTQGNNPLPTIEEPKAPVLNAPKLLTPTSPEYPSLAKFRGLEMKVKVNFTVDRNGKVKDIDFAKQQNVNYFKSAIRSTIRKWRFTPATLNDDVIETKVSKIFSFSLQS